MIGASEPSAWRTLCACVAAASTWSTIWARHDSSSSPCKDARCHATACEVARDSKAPSRLATSSRRSGWSSADATRQRRWRDRSSSMPSMLSRRCAIGASSGSSAANTWAASDTERATTPTVSSDGASCDTPPASITPAPGLNPTTPQVDAGMRTDPAVSVPSEARHKPAATATAEPLDDPPTAAAGSSGFSGAGKCGFSAVAPQAYSAITRAPR
ncbi:hypothetical protein D3C72_1494240 [compost metagenome]